MKKLALTICLIVIAITTRSQAVLEHTYQNEDIYYGWVLPSPGDIAIAAGWYLDALRRMCSPWACIVTCEAFLRRRMQN